MKKLKADKSLGQNFLKDAKFCGYIADMCLGFSSDLTEIGCGTGLLTKAILSKMSPEHKLHGIEADERMEPYLEEISGECSNFSYQIGDFFKGEIGDRSPLYLCGNLPYNIGSKIVAWCAENNVEGFVFLLQKEVSQKIAAKISSSEYAAISALVQAFFHLSLGRVIPPGAFEPAPKVNSQLLIARRKRPTNPDTFARLSKVLRSAFLCRRKILKNTLCKRFQYLTDSVDPLKRPQDLSPEEYLDLAEQLN